MSRQDIRFSRLASASRALDFGSAARAHAFVPPGPPRSKAHISSEHVVTGTFGGARSGDGNLPFVVLSCSGLFGFVSGHQPSWY
jgi:hypothetical protein